ncbi:MAG: hypothetical protein ABSG05_01155 [Candidatus Pacearchaeota archaeon]|jgi:hypothetical protein
MRFKPEVLKEWANMSLSAIAGSNEQAFTDYTKVKKLSKYMLRHQEDSKKDSELTLIVTKLGLLTR